MSREEVEAKARVGERDRLAGGGRGRVRREIGAIAGDRGDIASDRELAQAVLLQIERKQRIGAPVAPQLDVVELAEPSRERRASVPVAEGLARQGDDVAAV